MTSATGTTQNGTVDFGLFRPMLLGSRVWNDRNNDGLLNNSESGLANVAVEVYRDTNGDGTPDGAPLGNTTTDASGSYTFTNLISGTYVVVVTNTNFLPGGALGGWHNSEGAASDRQQRGQ